MPPRLSLTEYYVIHLPVRRTRLNKQAKSDILKKVKVLELEYAEKSGNVRFTCRKYDVFREDFYRWRNLFERKGRETPVNSKPALRIRNFIGLKLKYKEKGRFPYTKKTGFSSLYRSICYMFGKGIKKYGFSRF